MSDVMVLLFDEDEKGFYVRVLFTITITVEPTNIES
jgi:hypothetical protein